MDQVLFGIVIVVMLVAAFGAIGLAASRPVPGMTARTLQRSPASPSTRIAEKPSPVANPGGFVLELILMLLLGGCRLGELPVTAPLGDSANEPSKPAVSALPEGVAWETGTVGTKTPFTLVHGSWIQVDVAVGEKTNALIFDTGMGESEFDRKHFFPPGVDAWLTRAELPPVMVGTMEWASQPNARVSYFSSTDFGAWFPGAGGILGADMIESIVTIIDYPARTIEWLPRDQFKPRANDVPISGVRGNESLIVPVRVAGLSGSFLLDTGSNGVVVMDLEGASALVPPGAWVVPGGTAGLMRPVQSWFGSSEIQVGPFVWKRGSIVVQSDFTGGHFGLDGELGAPFLKHFRVTIDPTASKLWLALEAPLEKEPPLCFYGFRIDPVPRTPTVGAVLPRGPADAAGIQTGDEILSANGVPSKSIDRWGTQWCKEPKEPLRLRLKRDKRLLDVTLNGLVIRT